MIPINHHGLTVGWVDEEVYYTERREEHFFRMFNGYAISTDVLLKAHQAGATMVKMKIPFGKFVFSTIQKWALEGQKYMDGEDEQRVLSLEQLKDDIYVSKDYKS